MDPVSGLMLMLMGGILVVFVIIPFLYENWKKSHQH